MANDLASTDAAAVVRAPFERVRAAWRAQPPLDVDARLALLGKLQAWVVGNQDKIVQAISADFGHRSAHETKAAEIALVVGDLQHTRAHLRLSASHGRERLREEIFGGKRRLEEALGHSVDAFAWVGGAEADYSAEAARLVREAGFRFSFMTNHAPFRPGGDLHQIQRSNVEASYPLDLLRFQISGLMDLLYTPKRRRVDRLTRTAPARAAEA